MLHIPNSDDQTPEWSVQSQLIHNGMERSSFGETAEALYLTSGYVYDSAEQAEARFKGEDDGYIYSRYGNPTVSLFEQRLAALEGTERCVAVSSGMAAMHAALACRLQAGDHLVASKALFGSCLQVITTLLPRYGITYTLVDGTDLAAWEAAITTHTKVFFCETPANPTLALVDIAAVGQIAEAAGITFVVDNAFASPVVQRAAPAGRGRHHLLRDEAHRRTGPLHGRRDLLLRAILQRSPAKFCPAHRSLTQPIQRLDAGQGAGNAGFAGFADGRKCPEHC